MWVLAKTDEALDEGTEIAVCGWCHLDGPLQTDDDVRRELAAAAADSLSWRWRWRPGRG